MTHVGDPRALHRAVDELPMVDAGGGVGLQLLQVDIEHGLWVVRNRFAPGVKVQRHKHTGCVHALTFSGSWRYLEYPEVNTAGSYLYEPANSIHTLIVPEDNTEVTEVVFAIYGANLNLDADGNVESVFDATTILEAYLAMCEAYGPPPPGGHRALTAVDAAAPAIDLLDPASFAHGHPHAQYRWLRDHDPVHWHTEPDGPGFWAVTRHADVNAVGRDPGTFSSSRRS